MSRLPRQSIPAPLVATALVAAFAAVALAGVSGGGGAGAKDLPGLRLAFLDVGQGDAILLEPSDGDAVLVDGGPPGDDLRHKLSDEGVHRLAAAVVTHDQSDHAGGIEEAIGSLPISALVYGDQPHDLRGEAAAAHVRTVHVAEGSEIRSGSLRLDVLSPPGDEPPVPGQDLNERALVILARWHAFTALLTADAEAETVPYDPGPIQILKVAHHGSIDAGLDALLDRSVPKLAVVSVGAGNDYGHPTPETLATLSRHGVPVLRTDRDGTVRIQIDADGWAVRP